MFATLYAELSKLDELDLLALTPTKSVRLLEDLATVQRRINGLIARVAKHVEDSGSYMLNGDRNAPAMVARTLGIGCNEARAATSTARKLEALPATRAAVSRGELSARQAE